MRQHAAPYLRGGLHCATALGACVRHPWRAPHPPTTLRALMPPPPVQQGLHYSTSATNLYPAVYLSGFLPGFRAVNLPVTGLAIAVVPSGWS
eukprot:1040513-Prorocentrum_minimum.AAC.2